MEVATINTVLGQRAGVLELVFGLLPPRDMKNVVLVCQLWREVGEAPRFWAWVVLRENMSTMPERLSCSRLQAVRELRVEWRVDVSEEMLQAVARHQGLRVMGMGGAHLSLVDPGLLARVVNRLEEVEMWSLDLTVKQWEEVMIVKVKGDSRLKKLDLSNNILPKVDAGLLARAVARLEEVKLWDTRLTMKQWEDVMTAIGQGDSRLKKLEISNNNMSKVDPGLLARAVNRLEEVDMYRTQLTFKQAEAILTQSLVKTSLRKLEFSEDWNSFPDNDPEDVDEDLVARARLVIGELRKW